METGVVGGFHPSPLCHSALDAESYSNRRKDSAFAGMTAFFSFSTFKKLEVKKFREQFRVFPAAWET